MSDTSAMTAEAVHALTDADLAKVAEMVREWSVRVQAEIVARKIKEEGRHGMAKDVFERLKSAGAGMGTRDPKDYSFIISVDDAVRVGGYIDEMELALHSIAGHGNITGERAREIAARALSIRKPD